MVTLLLVSLAFYAVPVSGYKKPPVKVGVIGPMYWMAGQGMWEGAQLARDLINDAGGINGHEVVLYHESDQSVWAPGDPAPESGYMAMLQLMDCGVDFVQGGFRSEAVRVEREVAMDNQRIFTITGASADELIDHPDTVTYPDTVRADYDRYKYMFRTAPVNSTTLFKSIAEFLKYVMVEKLTKIYVLPLKIAVVSDDRAWTEVMHAHLSSATFWNVEMGMEAYGSVSVVYSGKVDPIDAFWVQSVMTEIDQSDARLIIELFSGPSGHTFARQWGILQVDAALVGVNVWGQEYLHWAGTGGVCETEALLVTAGGADDPNSGNPINTEGPVKTQDFYRDYYNKFGHAPIYTSYGSFDTLMGLKETIENWIVQVGHDWPYRSQDEYDLLIPIMEMTNRHGIAGWFRFTGPNPLPGGQTYPPAFDAINPTRMGTLHDVACYDLGSTWPGGYTRPLMASWQAGRLEIVFPLDQPYSKGWGMPYWAYPYRTDLNENRQHDATDVVIVSYAFGTKPGDPRWNWIADTDDYLKPLAERDVDGDDLVRVSADYGKSIPIQP